MVSDHASGTYRVLHTREDVFGYYRAGLSTGWTDLARIVGNADLLSRGALQRRGDRDHYAAVRRLEVHRFRRGDPLMTDRGGSTPVASRQAGAREMIRGVFAIALILAGCSRNTGGPLDPVEAPGVQLSKDARGNRTATVQAGAVSAKASARWSDTGGQSAMLVYTNHGARAVRIELGSLAMSGPAGEAVVMSAADVTNVDLVDTRTDNDDACVIVQRDDKGVARGSFDLPPGAKRRVDAQLSPFSNMKAAATGNEVTLRVPMPSTPRKIGFVARRPSLLPF